MNFDTILTGRRRILLPFGIAIVYLFFYSNWLVRDARPHAGTAKFAPGVLSDDEFFWRKVPEHYPVRWMKPLPSGPPRQLWRVQADFEPESASDRAVRLERQAAVKDAFRRCWASYRDHAWGHDELLPTNGGGSRDPFGGWAATLVDSLDTLLIMNMTTEYDEAAQFAAHNISFGDPAGSPWASNVNVFETTIRYLGGLLAAYDLKGDQRLLRKARELGDMLYKAFDTPNRLPISRWDMLKAATGAHQVAPEYAVIAEIGSLCVEFTRLSLITGDPKWWDATERIRALLEQQQISTQLPG